jgi:ABC-type amino acid transport system permease subunit
MNNWFEQLYETFIVDKNYMMLLEGFGNTIIITLCALAIGVVIGGVILAGLYALFNTTIIPTLTSKITQMFNYAG